MQPQPQKGEQMQVMLCCVAIACVGRWLRARWVSCMCVFVVGRMVAWFIGCGRLPLGFGGYAGAFMHLILPCRLIMPAEPVLLHPHALHELVWQWPWVLVCGVYPWYMTVPHRLRWGALCACSLVFNKCSHALTAIDGQHACLTAVA